MTVNLRRLLEQHDAIAALASSVTYRRCDAPTHLPVVTQIPAGRWPAVTVHRCEWGGLWFITSVGVAGYAAPEKVTTALQSRP